MTDFEQAHASLAAWCRARDYAGHDPFDGLNSSLFQSLPLLPQSRFARLAWTQMFKRAPVNLRALAGVPVGRNPKGTALFALAALARWRTHGHDADAQEARSLLDNLLAARVETKHGAAWGYNFDWQGRAFYAPRGTPTVVPTAFAARALVEAHQAFGDESYLRVAREVCVFILRDLQRSEETGDEVCFSYSPLDRTRVFNASLLAGEVLASVGALLGDAELSVWGARAAHYVVRRQRADGSWAYGADSYQSRADNFHTAFILTSLARITDAEAGNDDERAVFASSMKRGYDFWRAHFFLADGWPKYFHDQRYPADAHAAGAAIVALSELSARTNGAPELAQLIARWSIAHLRDRRGFFYYQRRRTHTVRIPYMRWTQAWMLYALARLNETMNAER